MNSSKSETTTTTTHLLPSSSTSCCASWRVMLLLLVVLCDIYLQIFPFRTCKSSPFTVSTQVAGENTFSSSSSSTSASPSSSSFDYATFLKGCKNIYLDFGTNVGIQIRKIYEPHLYPNALILPKFDQYLGPVDMRRSGVCTIGFEPNPHHTQRLQHLEAAYNKQGWKTHIFTETGIGHKEGWLRIVIDNDVKHNEWGTRLEEHPNYDADTQGAIHVVAITDVFREVLKHTPSNITTTTPAPDGTERQIITPPTILMKIDIEGNDEAVMKELFKAGMLCSVKFAYIEHINRDKVRDLTNVFQTFGCDSTFDTLDDEDFNDSNFSIPE